MTPTLEGMARAAYEYEKGFVWDSKKPSTKYIHMLRQKKALLWLAENVTDEMVKVAVQAEDETTSIVPVISAALRAAAGEP
jgi:hypothetical protein